MYPLFPGEGDFIVFDLASSTAREVFFNASPVPSHDSGDSSAHSPPRRDQDPREDFAQLRSCTLLWVTTWAVLSTGKAHRAPGPPSLPA